MKIEFKLDPTELAQLHELIDSRRRRGSNMTPAMQAVQDDFMRLEDAVFRTSGRLILARGWRPLSPRYLAERKRRGQGTRILELRGPLGGRIRKSVTKKGARYQHAEVTADSMTLTTRLGIAKVHQKGGTVNVTRGTTTTQVRIPRRRFVHLRREDQARWLGMSQEYITTGHVRPRRLGV